MPGRFPRNSSCDAIDDELHPGRRGLRLSFELGKGSYATIMVKRITDAAELVVMNLEVLFEDNHCLAVNKPAGLLSQGDVSGEPSLVDLVGALSEDAVREAGECLRGAAAPARSADVGRHASGQDQQGGRPAFSAVSRRDDLEALLGDRGRTDRRAGRGMDRRARKGQPARTASGIVLAGSSSGKEARVAFRVLERWARFTKLELGPGPGEATSSAFSSRAGACRSSGMASMGRRVG